MLDIDKKSLIDSETLTKYLAYTKRINPTLTKEAEQKIRILISEEGDTEEINPKDEI